MTKNPLLLYDAKVILEFEGQWLEMDAVSEISGDSSIIMTGPTRKTLFGYSPDLLRARQHGGISLTLSTYITSGFPEVLFFKMAGMDIRTSHSAVLSYPEVLGKIQPQATIYILSTSGSFCLRGCVLEGIDMPFSKEQVGQLSVSLNQKSIDVVDTNLEFPVVPKKQGQHMRPGPVESQISGYTASQVSQTSTLQRSLLTLGNTNCFNYGEVASLGHRMQSDSSFGISVQEYVTKERLEMPDTFEAAVELSQSGLVLRCYNGIVTKRMSVATTHSLVWDFKATSTIEIIGPK